MKPDLTFRDWIEKLKNPSIAENWITIYQALNKDSDPEQKNIYSGLVRKRSVKEVLKSANRDIKPYSKIYWFDSSLQDKASNKTYSSYRNEPVEPLLYIRDFNEAHPYNLCILEELIVCLDLIHKKEQGRDIYFYKDDNGKDIDAIKVNDVIVQVKKSVLYEYMFIKKMHFVLYFELIRKSELDLDSFGLDSDVKDYVDHTMHYQLFPQRHVSKSQKCKSSSLFQGKRIYKLPKGYTSWHMYSDRLPKEYVSFKVGYDTHGHTITYTCDPKFINGEIKSAPTGYTPVYFNREVLKKYYLDPSRYEVYDGYVSIHGGITLKIDNNHQDAVVVFLRDLSELPHEEQNHWKSYNIDPLKGISEVSLRRSFIGEFTAPVAEDLVFKNALTCFYDTWREKHGWDILKPLSEKDAYHLKSLHVPTDESDKELLDSIISLHKIIVDSLNNKKLKEYLDESEIEKDQKSIKSLMKYLAKTGSDFARHTEYLHYLNDLRSALSHRQSETMSSRDKKTREEFKLDTMSKPDVVRMALKKAIDFLLFLEHIPVMNQGKEMG